MDKNTKKIFEEYRKEKNEKIFFIVGTLIFLLFLSFIILNNSNNSSSVSTKTIPTETLTVEEKFAVLSVAKTNSCGGGAAVVNNMPDDGRIQGSCCTKMNLHKYEEQIEGLKKYSDYEIIPKDPYDVSVIWAREMIEYNEQTQLTSEQQIVYDKAVKVSNEGGPCCCVCWHWYAYEGLAKKLIIEYDFTAEQIAEIWDLSDACGGAGHSEGGGH